MKNTQTILLVLLFSTMASVSTAQHHKDSIAAWIKSGFSKSAVVEIRSDYENRLSASLSRDGTLCVWETTNGKNAGVSFPNYDLEVRQLAFSHDGMYLATIASSVVYDPGSPRGNYHTDTMNVSLWKAVNGELVKEYVLNQEDPPDGIGFTSDDKELLLTNLNKIQTYDVKTGELLKESRPYIGGAFSPQSNFSVERSYHRSIAV